MERRPHILFTTTFPSSFINEDLRILRRFCHVTAVTRSGIPALLNYLAVLPRIDCTFSWFASVHSSLLVFFSRIAGKKSIIVLGGIDVAKEKEIGYGIWNSWWRAILVRYAIRHATRILAVDDFLRREAMRLAEYSGENIVTIPTGYDPDFWRGSGEKLPYVLTVGTSPDMARVKKKGLDVFLRTAGRFSSTRFVIVGIAGKVREQLQVPENVECMEVIPQTELLRLYQEAKVYCQLSVHEGLPNSLCEAMLCECIPVGTRVAGIPAAIGDTGFLVNYGDEAGTAAAIQAALADTSGRGKKARERIATHFHIRAREELLEQIIAELNR